MDKYESSFLPVNTHSRVTGISEAVSAVRLFLNILAIEKPIRSYSSYQRAHPSISYFHGAALQDQVLVHLSIMPYSLPPIFKNCNSKLSNMWHCSRNNGYFMLQTMKEICVCIHTYTYI